MKHFIESTDLRFERTYLSRAMSRGLSMDGPVGDPFGGPAYGRREMPVAAAIAFYAAVTVEVVTVFTVMTAIGSAMSLVGQVTGNAGLAKVGGVLALAGGVGQMAQGGMFDKINPGIKDWADEINTSIASNISPTAAPVEMSTVTNAAGTPTSVVDTPTELNLSKGAGIIDTPVAPSLDTQVSQAAGGNGFGTSTAADPLTGLPNIPSVDQLAQQAGNGLPVDTGTSPLNISKVGEPINAMQAAAQQGGKLDAVAKAAGTGIDTGTSLFDRISKFANDNKALTEMTLKGVSGMYVSPQDKALKEAQASSANALTGLYEAKTAEITGNAANANSIASVNGMQVNPNAQIYKPKPTVTAAGVRPAGLIQTRSA